MTGRERQILKWIEENPMISQEELAAKAKITRSSIAVHISNLMKKGYIAGRGYVLRSGTYVAVVGGVNMDIGGRSFKKLQLRDSNPGTVQVSLGGVGRNIAHNLALLEVDVRFLTAFGEDAYASRIEASCGTLGIDIAHARKVRGGATSTYLFLNDQDGDMAAAVSDMAICRHITPSYLAANLLLLNHAQIVLFDTNIPTESIAYLAAHCTAPLFADPVSAAKAEKLRPCLSRLHTLKPNRSEAEILSGIAIQDEKSLHQAARILLASGLHRVFISLGGDGVLACDQERMGHRKSFVSKMENATGAGDAFMAGLAYSYLAGWDLEKTTTFALGASAVAIESAETINPSMSVALIERKIAEKKRRRKVKC